MFKSKVKIKRHTLELAITSNLNRTQIFTFWIINMVPNNKKGRALVPAFFLETQ